MEKLLNALLAIADQNTPSASEMLQAFVDEVKYEESALPNGLARGLLDGTENAI